jgi:very-short-patch-repair endonuclease
VVASRQLAGIGLGPGAVRVRREGGRLHPLHRGVYAVGHRVLTPNGRRLAAVLAVGSGAVLSHRDAASLHGLRPTSRAAFEVTVARRGRRGRPGIEVHCVRALHPDDVTTVDGIPCTAWPRTVLDCADVLAPRGVERLLDAAVELRLYDEPLLHALLTRSPGRRAATVLRDVLATHAVGTTTTRSALEEAFLGLCARHGLARPEVDVHLGRYTADFLFRAARVVVECDGHAYHAAPGAMRRDRRRDLALQAEGWDVVRLTWEQVALEPGPTAAALRSVLARRTSLSSAAAVATGVL